MYVFQEAEIMEEAMNTDHLSMEKLLVHTIYIRTRNRLAELKKEIKSKVKGIQCKLLTIEYSTFRWVKSPLMILKQISFV